MAQYKYVLEENFFGTRKVHIGSNYNFVLKILYAPYKLSP